MPTSGSPRSTEPSIAELAEEHRKLRLAIDRVEQATDLRTLIPLLGGLHERLKEHFADEESPEGLARVVEESAPERLRHLEQLFEEHREFLAATISLMERTQALLVGPEADILTEVQLLGRKLKAHENRETELMMDSVYFDIGSGD